MNPLLQLLLQHFGGSRPYNFGGLGNSGQGSTQNQPPQQTVTWQGPSASGNQNQQAIQPQYGMQGIAPGTGTNNQQTLQATMPQNPYNDVQRVVAALQQQSQNPAYGLPSRFSGNQNFPQISANTPGLSPSGPGMNPNGNYPWMSLFGNSLRGGM